MYNMEDGGKREEEERKLMLHYVLARLAEAQIHAKNHTESGGKPFEPRQPYYRLRGYADDFMAGRRTENRLILLPGLRGVGKTTILLQLYNHLTGSGLLERDRVLYFSTDELKASLGRRIRDAITAFVEDVHRTSPAALDKELFVLVDEAHFDGAWSETAKITFDRSRKIFMVFTGSSALSLELSVDAARRTKKETVFPMSFSEHLLLKYGIRPPEGLSEGIVDLLFSGAADSASKLEGGLFRETTLRFGKPLSLEWEHFLCHGGFPFGLELEDAEIHERIFNMVERVIEKDVFALQSFNTETKNSMLRVLAFLALQTPGGTSDAKLADRLGLSPTLIRNVLDVLEKTHLIFSVKPYAGAGKLVRKPWKYYFLAPSIVAAMRRNLGFFDIRDREMLGQLAESSVAACLFRLKETTRPSTGVFYDADEGGADFLVRDAKDNIVPIEVGIGKKDKAQVGAAIRRYGSRHGIIVSDTTEKIRKEDNIVFVPLTTFSFV